MGPEAIASVGMGSSAAGGVLNFIGAGQKAQAESSMYKYKAAIALKNRDYALQAGENEAMRFGLKSQQQQGAIRAQQGASGVSVNSGSAVDVQRSAADLARMDMATIRANAAREAFGYESQAKMYSRAAKDTQRAGILAQMGSLVSGVSSVSSKWLEGQRMGIWGKSNSDYNPGFNMFAEER